ncbi:hypothetical protein GCK72_007468 [Caenorhabditis remanei]|uniref:BTB domain-containing protein n=1 Tax=Caenorhabditis remanei TaxID=31234 RepID=A0A6A5HJ70_CAERE|nr:hypothetical protein GCK72_007468 [Caenorhabditis remanei]KAF1767509.1 hypothetical protein GCK72_007468 [Caenorhabditis remanei]
MRKAIQQRSDEREKPMEMKKQKITNTPLESAIEKVLEICQKLLEKQENLEKSNMEIVEKLRLAEEKIDKISQKREEDTVEEKLNEETTNGIENSVIPTECSDEKSSQILPMTGKCFVLKHVFTNVLQMTEKKLYYGKEEEHFGVTWEFGLYGADPLIEWNRMKEEFLDDGKLAVEIHVKIKEMSGIYKNELKSFGDEMKSFSDVVLVVNEKKFHTLKLYLSGHSPYFNSLLMGNFQESKKSEIKLTGIDANDFQNYLELLYGEQSIDG